jgi:hypothetical protein
VEERELLVCVVVVEETLVDAVVEGAFVAVTVGGELEPQAASTAAAAPRPRAVAVGKSFISGSVGSRSQSPPPTVIVRRDGSESDAP